MLSEGFPTTPLIRVGFPDGQEVFVRQSVLDHIGAPLQISLE